MYPPSPMGELEHIGVFVRSVEDVGIVLDCIGGYHPDDPDSWPFRQPLIAEVPESNKPRFGYSVDLNYADPDHFGATIERLRRAGLDLAEIDIPFDSEFERCYDLYVPDAALTLELVPPEARQLVDPELLALAEHAQTMSVADYALVERVRERTRRIFARLFEDIDCLLTLTQQTLPNFLDEASPIMKQTRCFNITGQPAISIPAGSGPSGLPIGLQLDRLAPRDADLRRGLDLVGYPEPRIREPGFETLLSAIVSQQISTAAAAAIMDRLRAILPCIRPGDLLGLPDARPVFRGARWNTPRASRARSWKDDSTRMRSPRWTTARRSKRSPRCVDSARGAPKST